MLLMMIAGCSKPTTVPPPLVVGVHDYGEWKSYAPNEAPFRVYFPSDPTVNKPFEVTSPITQIIHPVSVQRQTKDGLGYMCSWISLDKPYSKAQERGYLEGQQRGSVRQSKGTIIEEGEFTLRGFLGREFIFDVPEAEVVSHDRVCIAGSLVVRLTVMGKDKQAVCSADALMFLDSLEFGK
jgi:hypothetical protein